MLGKDQGTELQRISSAVLQQPVLLPLPGQTGAEPVVRLRNELNQWLDSQMLFSGIFKIFSSLCPQTVHLFPKFLSALSHSEQVTPLVFTDISNSEYSNIAQPMLLSQHTAKCLSPPIVQCLFGCIWHASVVAFLHLLSYTFSQLNGHFLGLNSNKKWWGCCSAMTGFSPRVMGGPSLAAGPVMPADLLHICTCPHRRNKAINKRVIAENSCLPKHWLRVQGCIRLQGLHWSSNTLSRMSCEMQHLQADPWAGFWEVCLQFCPFSRVTLYTPHCNHCCCSDPRDLETRMYNNEGH